jgi:hypothetical protein
VTWQAWTCAHGDVTTPVHRDLARTRLSPTLDDASQRQGKAPDPRVAERGAMASQRRGRITRSASDLRGRGRQLARRTVLARARGENDEEAGKGAAGRS